LEAEADDVEDEKSGQGDDDGALSEDKKAVRAADNDEEKVDTHAKEHAKVEKEVEKVI
jgi:hypothetical protein